CAVPGCLCVFKAWGPAHVKTGRAAWHSNTLWRGKRMPSLPVCTRATRFSANLVTCIASPCSRLTVMVVGLGLGKCVCDGGFVLFTERSLAVAVEVQKVAEIFAEVPICSDCELDPEVRGVRVCDRTLQT